MSGTVKANMDKGSITDSEDQIERIVDIYISAEAVRDMKHKKDTENVNTTKPQTPQRTGSDGVKIRSSRAAAVCLVLLCVLLLTAVIVLCVHIHTKSTNYTRERQKLLTKISNLTEERDQLLNNNTNMIQLNVQFNQEKNELSKYFQDGWIYYQFSLYYISNETKSWAESRKYCTERGADLIIINNSEKQDFVKKITCRSKVWIGLTDRDEEGTWKWVDNSTLTSGFWWSGEPNGKRSENCIVNLSTGWADYPCTRDFKWICEKKN